MDFRRWIAPVCFVLALCFALGGQARAADLSNGDDPDEITYGSDDSMVALRQELTLEPPKASSRAVSPAPFAGHGRRVIAELFRPPITAVVSTVSAV